MYSVQLLSCVLLFALPWTAAHHYVLNPRKSKLPWKIPSHRSEWPLSKNLQRIWVAENGGKKEVSYTLSGGVNGCRNYQNQQGGSLSTKHPESSWPNNPTSGLRPREKSEFTVTRAPLFSRQLDWQRPRTRIVAGQNLGFLCPVKPNRKYGDRVWRRYEGSFYSQASRDGNTVRSCLKDCAPPTPPMKSLGAHIKQGLTVRSGSTQNNPSRFWLLVSFQIGFLVKISFIFRIYLEYF